MEPDVVPDFPEDWVPSEPEDAYLEGLYEEMQGVYDDDPNPYHGTYSDGGDDSWSDSLDDAYNDWGGEA
jgi:hypothetical protein